MKKKTKKIGKSPKKHKNVWITFAFVFQRMKTNVMLSEHEIYVQCILHISSSSSASASSFSSFPAPQAQKKAP